MKERDRQRLKNGTIIAIYIAFCVAVLIISSVTITRTVRRNISSQINNILSLMSEKVNTSFSMMTDYIAQAADITSAHKGLSYDITYQELISTIENMPYSSIGIISADKTIYGTAGEKLDMEKQGFIEETAKTDDLYISEPYRSSVTGTNMITMFAPVYHNGKRSGSVFVTYYLEEIQKLAYTNILSEETEVALMNPFSGNFVNCSESGGNPPGTWSNTRLIKSEIEPMEGYDYDRWISNMQNKSPDNIINYVENNVRYTQAYVDIDGMENWDLVIRIPITELSDSMGVFTLGLVETAALLILATMLLAFMLYNREHKQNETLKTLSDIDPLTKVINRRGFDERLEKMFADKSQLSRSTFIFFDIDYFKEVNDNYGHDAGDQVLCNVARTLTDAFEDTGIVARVGGDEFNIFVYEPLTVADIDSIMANLRAQLKENHLSSGVALPITYSAGLAVYPQDACELKELIECADKALYHGKENGRNNHSWYNDMKKS